MKIQVFAKETVVLVIVDDEFVIFSRTPNQEGFGGATFSFPLTAKLADRIEKSGIIRVEKFNIDGILKYRELPFYTMERLIDVFTDVLQHVQNNDNNG